MQTIIKLMSYFCSGYFIGWMIQQAFSGFRKWRTGKPNKKIERVERSLTTEEKEYCRDYYKEYKDDPNVIHLSFDTFKSYYSLNPDSWILGDYFALREKAEASDFARNEAKRKSQYGAGIDFANEFATIFASHYLIQFNTVDDYFKYVCFRKDKKSA